MTEPGCAGIGQIFFDHDARVADIAQSLPRISGQAAAQ